MTSRARSGAKLAWARGAQAAELSEASFQELLERLQVLDKQNFCELAQELALKEREDVVEKLEEMGPEDEHDGNKQVGQEQSDEEMTWLEEAISKSCCSTTHHQHWPTSDGWTGTN